MERCSASVEPTRELGVLPHAIYLSYHILTFYVISHYALLDLKKKKVDIHKVPRDKKYVSDLTTVGPNRSEEDNR